MDTDDRLILADGTEPILSPDGQIITGIGGVYQFTDGDGTVYILGGPSEERQNEHRECVADLRAAIEEIVNDDLDTYRKLLLGGLSLPEIADQLEMPVAMVAQMRAEAVQELRAEIARQREARTKRSAAPPRGVQAVRRARPRARPRGRRAIHTRRRRIAAGRDGPGDDGPAEPPPALTPAPRGKAAGCPRCSECGSVLLFASGVEICANRRCSRYGEAP